MIEYQREKKYGFTKKKNLNELILIESERKAK
jgi:hypothetical protein